MGTFCTTTSLETMWVGSSFADLTTLAQEFIGDAEDELRSKLAQRYDTSTDPFQTSTSTPPLLEKLCKWKSIGYLYGNTSRGGKEAFKRADWYLNRCDKMLEKIMDYKAHLVDTAGSQIPDSSDKLAVKSTSSDYSNTFNEDDPLKWKTDQDKLDDIKSERD